jgi:hypothetical protein
MSRVLSLLGALSLIVASACDAGEIDSVGGSADASGGGGDGGGGADAGVVAGEPTELQGITAAHNQVRGAKGVVDLEWDNDLAAVAQAWADGCQWGHNAGRSDNYPGYVGENIYGAGFVPSGPQVTESGAWCFLSRASVTRRADGKAGSRSPRKLLG